VTTDIGGILGQVAADPGLWPIDKPHVGATHPAEVADIGIAPLQCSVNAVG